MGKPGWSYVHSLFAEYIGIVAVTRGTETSYYPEEDKVNNDSGSSGERPRKSPNFLSFQASNSLNKLVDEYLKRVVTLQTTFCRSWTCPASA